MISAIPTHWIGEAPTSGELFWVSKEKAKELITFLGKSNKTVYKHLRSKSRLLPIKQQRKWCDALQILPNHIDWNKIYENNYFATNETKFRSFQIRLNLRFIATNVQLAGFGIVDSNYCVFCSEEPETIIHLFCMCKFVVTFWQDLSDWLSVKLHHDFNLENLHKLFGYENCNGVF